MTGFVTPDAWRRAGQTFAWRGHEIFYRVEGDGEPLLLIHGFPTASWDFAPIWSALCARYRVLTLDMIGLGFSAKPRDFAYSIMAQADLFEAFLAREQVTSYRVLAHDYGDTVAQELLARQPAGPRITAVALLNGGLFPETHRPLLTQKLLASRLGPLVARVSTFRTFAAAMRRIWGQAPLPDHELATMWALVIAGDGRRVMPALLGYIAERRRHRARWVGALTGTTIPIRLIAGMRDPISGAHMVERYGALVPHPDVVELPTVGHYPQLEAPEAVLAAVLAGFAAGSR